MQVNDDIYEWETVYFSGFHTIQVSDEVLPFHIKPMVASCGQVPNTDEIKMS